MGENLHVLAIMASPVNWVKPDAIKKERICVRQVTTNDVRVLCMPLSKVARRMTLMVCGASMLSVMHSILDALEVAVVTLDFTELDM
jgi:hypothetical protein